MILYRLYNSLLHVALFHRSIPFYREGKWVLGSLREFKVSGTHGSAGPWYKSCQHQSFFPQVFTFIAQAPSFLCANKGIETSLQSCLILVFSGSVYWVTCICSRIQCPCHLMSKIMSPCCETERSQGKRWHDHCHRGRAGSDREKKIGLELHPGRTKPCLCHLWALRLWHPIKPLRSSAASPQFSNEGSGPDFAGGQW